MSKAEKFIEERTKKCSNLAHFEDLNGNVWEENTPWITPDQARRAVEIAREETLNKVCEWIEENIGEYCDGENIMFSATLMENIDVFEQERFINDFKQAMKDE